MKQRGSNRKEQSGTSLHLQRGSMPLHPVAVRPPGQFLLAPFRLPGVDLNRHHFSVAVRPPGMRYQISGGPLISLVFEQGSFPK